MHQLRGITAQRSAACSSHKLERHRQLPVCWGSRLDPHILACGSLAVAMVESVLHQQATELRGAFSKLQQERITSKCIKPSVVLSGTSHVVAEKEALGAKNHHDKIEALFPNTYGKPRVELSTGDAANAITKALRLAVVLSGGQAPGGHNVIAGVFDYAMKCSPESK
eukprot:11345-Heterococcus_DN1.PRE.3